MKTKRVPKLFFNRHALEVSKDVLGKYLVVRGSGRRLKRGRIVEVEAYVGPQDRASHAYKGKKTFRNRAEFLSGGYVYIYLVYGMYWQLNITTGKKNHPECFLIRALDLGKNSKSVNGPGKLCRYFGLNGSFYGENVSISKKIWLEDKGERIDKKDIISAKRIGIDYAGRYWSARKLRFYIKGNKAISKTK